MSDEPIKVRTTVNAVGFIGLLLAGLIVFSCVGVKVQVEHVAAPRAVEAPR